MSRERGVPECGGQGACKETSAEREAGRRGARRCWNIPGREPAGGPVARARARLRGFAAGPHSGPAPPSCGGTRGRGSRLALQDERGIERRCVTATRDGSGAAHPARPPPGAAAGGRGRARAPCTWSTSGGSPEGRDTPGVSARKTSHLPPAHTFFFLFSDDVFY